MYVKGQLQLRLVVFVSSRRSHDLNGGLIGNRTSSGALKKSRKTRREVILFETGPFRIGEVRQLAGFERLAVAGSAGV